MSRNKGQRGEREFIAILQQVIDKVFGEDVYELKRNLFQTREGGYDVTGLPQKYDRLAVEVKFQENLNINKWWEQTIEQAIGKKIPVLAFRQSRKKWRIMMDGVIPTFMFGGHTPNSKWNRGYSCRVELSLEDFLLWYEIVLREEVASET